MNKDILTTDKSVRIAECMDSGDIYIHFMEDGTPVAYEQSALLLHRYFPEYPVIRVSGPGSREDRAIKGFPLEEVLERFDARRLQVDDTCIRIMGVV